MIECVPQECRIGKHHFILREVGVGDAAAVLALFSRVFGEVPPAGWDIWKYSAQGLSGKAFGLWDETRNLVAHFAGVPRSIHWHGQQINAIQIGDMMVAPEIRGLLTRRGPLFRVSTAFFEKWVGTGKPYAFAFGFTHEKAMRLIETLGLFIKIEAIQRLVWPSGCAQLPWEWEMTELDPSMPDFDHTVDYAWRAMALDNEGRILGMRHASYLHARFAQRPGIRHRFIVVSRRWFGPKAISVVRETNGVLRWLDFIGPRMALPAATAAIRNCTAKAGATEIETWASTAALADLQPTGALVTGVASYFALAKVSHCPDDSLMTAGWWLAGDTDYL